MQNTKEVPEAVLETWPSARRTTTAFPASIFGENSLTVRPSESLAVLGKSGSGKSTLLGVLGGLVDTQGWARWTGADTYQTVALMAQSAGLLPWFSVADNITIGSRLRGEILDTIRCDELLRRVGLDDVRDALPETLSGGMQQRAALARSLYEDADLLLLDEPYSSLDAITRRQMQELTRQETSQRTLVLVTHDPAEAWLMGDRIIILEGSPAQFEEFDKSERLETLWQRVLQSPASITNAVTASDSDTGLILDDRES
ncbi:MAG: ATP-binding cassette domain-containing protein [Pseudomonadota bacterium]